MSPRNFRPGIVVGLLVAIASSASAGPGTTNPLAHERFTLNDADPESSIPSAPARDASPLEFGYFLQDILDRALAATQARNFDAAIRYYRAVAKAVPDRALAFSKLCMLLELTEQREAAQAACHTALGLQGVIIEDYVRYVRLILAVPGKPALKDVDDVKALVAHLQAQPEARQVGHDLQCQMGLRLGDVAMLEQCTAGLATAAPDDAKTVSYQWSLALLKGDRDQASHLIARAEAAGVAPPALRLMREQTAARVSRWPTRLADWRFSTALAVAVLAAAATVLVASRRRRPTAQRTA